MSSSGTCALGLLVSGVVSGRWVLSVAGPPGGFNEIEAAAFTIDARELPGRVGGLAGWARDRMRSRFVPVGLYMAVCEIDQGEDKDPLIVASQSFPWADLGPWPLDAWTHPALSAKDDAA